MTGCRSSGSPRAASCAKAAADRLHHGRVSIGVGVIIFMSAALAGQQANIVKRVLSSQPHIVLLPPQEAARPLRATWPRPRSCRSRCSACARSTSGRRSSRSCARSVAAVAARLRAGVRRARRGLALGEPAGSSPTATSASCRSPRRSSPAPAPRRAGRRDRHRPRHRSRRHGRRQAQPARRLGLGATLTVSGLVDLGSKFVNQRTAFVALQTAQALLGLPGGVSAIDVTVHDIYAAEDIAQRSAPAPGSKPTAGSRPTRSSSSRSTRRWWPIPRSASSSAWRWRSASPRC